MSEAATPAVDENTGTRPTHAPSSPPRDVPWQIWVVVALLVPEGIGNLLGALNEPIELSWFLSKCLFIVGLVRGWKWVFALFLFITSLHVLYFLEMAPLVSLMNLALIGFTLSARSYFFGPRHTAAAAKTPV